MKNIFNHLTKKIFVILIFFLTKHFSYSQILFLLDYNNGNTYTISCGTVNPATWTVSNDTCTLTTAQVQLPSSPATQTISASVTIEGAGMDNADVAKIQYSVNGSWVTQSSINGQPGTHKYKHAFKIVAAASSVISISVNCFNDATSEQWRIFNGDITIGNAPPLPVELTSFHAEKNNNEIYFSWTTATETENKYFTLERSADGITFSRIAEISGAGNSSAVKNYTATDEEPFAGKNYYQLTQTDWNGKKHHCSEIMFMDFGNISSVFTVFPNPLVSSELHLHLNSSEQKEFVVLIADDRGRKIDSRIILSAGNEQIFSVPGIREKLLPGIYIVTASNRNNIYKQKLIVP